MKKLDFFFPFLLLLPPFLSPFLGRILETGAEKTKNEYTRITSQKQFRVPMDKTGLGARVTQFEFYTIVCAIGMIVVRGIFFFFFQKHE